MENNNIVNFDSVIDNYDIKNCNNKLSDVHFIINNNNGDDQEIMNKYCLCTENNLLCNDREKLVNCKYFNKIAKSFPLLECYVLKSNNKITLSRNISIGNNYDNNINELLLFIMRFSKNNYGDEIGLIIVISFYICIHNNSLACTNRLLCEMLKKINYIRDAYVEEKYKKNKIDNFVSVYLNHSTEEFFDIINGWHTIINDLISKS